MSSILYSADRVRKIGPAIFTNFQNMIKAVIFDLNGVFIQSPKLSDRFRDEFGVSPNEFLLVLKEIMAKVRLPNAGDAYEYWGPYLEKWGLKIDKDEFFSFWFSAEKEVPEMISLARGFRAKGLKVLILSNNFVERASYYDRTFPFLKEIADKIYYSWQTGFVKPSPEAYKKVLQDNNLKPEECVYFDDSEENIKVANDLGIKSFIFSGPSDTKEKIKAM